MFVAYPPPRLQADEIYTVRSIVHPILQAEWDLRCVQAVLRCSHQPHTAPAHCNTWCAAHRRYMDHQRKRAAEEAEIMKGVRNDSCGCKGKRHVVVHVDALCMMPA